MSAGRPPTGSELPKRTKTRRGRVHEEPQQEAQHIKTALPDIDPIIDEKTLSFLDLAAHCDHHAIVSMIREFPFDERVDFVNLVDKEGRGAAHHVLKGPEGGGDDIPFNRVLLTLGILNDYGLDINHQANNGDTILHRVIALITLSLSLSLSYTHPVYMYIYIYICSCVRLC